MSATAEQQVALSSADDIALADKLRAGHQQIISELRKLIIGQDDVIEQVLVSLFAGGNCLIIGVPGLAKTLLVHTIARVLDLNYSRIQFTPDLMPSDITGTDIIQDDPASGQRRMVFTPGPVFANIVLADEINRTPPKTQSAMLEAMQEHRVTVQGKTYDLREPFFVFATQNPIELEGTYPLPEAQLDRFLLRIAVGYPSAEEEREILERRRRRREDDARVMAVVSREELCEMQRALEDVFVSDSVERYVVDLYLYECHIQSGELAPLAVNAFKWVTSAEFDRYPFTPADEASMNKLLGVAYRPHCAYDRPACSWAGSDGPRDA